MKPHLVDGLDVTDLSARLRAVSSLRELELRGEDISPPIGSALPGLPSFQSLTRQLLDLGTMTRFTAQFRGETLASFVSLLKSWGMRALDVAGNEPGDLNAEQDIYRAIDLAREYGIGVFGGSDYRGSGTGWTTRQPWMSHPAIQATVAALIGK